VLAASLGIGGAAVPARASASAPVGRTPSWTARNQPGDAATAIAVGPRAIFVAGPSDAGHFLTVAYEATRGAERWEATYDSGGAYDTPRAIAVSPDGSRVFVTGESPGGGATLPDYTTVAYDATTGGQLWVADYDGPAHDTDSANLVRVSPDGLRVFVSGYSWSDQTAFDFATVAYDASTGTQLWVTRYDGLGGRDFPAGLQVAPDGSRLFVTGTSPAADDDVATVAYDSTTGAQLWLERYTSGGTQQDTAVGLAISPDGSKIFTTGCTAALAGCVDGDFLTVSLAADDGRLLWASTFDGIAHGQDVVEGIGVSPDGSTVFVGGTSAGVTGNDEAVVAYTASGGVPIWTSVYNGPGNAADLMTGLVVSPDGTAVYTSGQSTPIGAAGQMATVAFDAATGSKAWFAFLSAARLAGSYAYAVGVSASGGAVFVAGQATAAGSSSSDFATLAYRT
jgi:putative pyrroloquinoline-quinone binding quinoprotein